MKADLRQYIEEKGDNKCCWVGCCADGKHPAPKSPTNLKERYGFCLDHVRKYNKSWDFFHDMNDYEVESFMTDSITGHRPTGPMGSGFRKYNTEDLKEELFREFNFGNKKEKQKRAIPTNEKEALRVIGLKYPVTMSDIKKKYKELAKQYHPDINGIADEEKLKTINQAYSYLKSCGQFS